MRKTALIVAALCALPLAAHAAATSGTAAAGFLKLPGDTATAARGEAAAAVPGAMALFANPAGLAGAEKSEAAFTHAVLMESLSYDAFAAAVPVGPGTLGAGAVSLGYGAMDVINKNKAVVGSMSPRDTSYSLGWAMPLAEGFYAGAAVKRVESKIYGSAATNALDLGLLLRSEDLSVALAAQHMGAGLKFNTQASPLPVNVKLGVLMPYQDRWEWVADLNFPKDGPAWLAAGAQREFSFSGTWKLFGRAGYNSAALDTEGVNGFTCGFGLEGRQFGFDYALRTAGALGITHHLGLSFKWGGKPPPPPPAPVKPAAKAAPASAPPPPAAAPAKVSEEAPAVKKPARRAVKKRARGGSGAVRPAAAPANNR